MKKYHSIVVGAGIAGMEASLNLAAQGYKVLLVEKEPSIGGNMIGLSKVFPTLDCSSCITTPKMSETAHSDNIEVMTYAEVSSIEKQETGFKVTVLKKPRYVSEKHCIGCKKCEDVCPVYVKHEFERELGAKKAVCIPFTTAIPQTAVLDPKYCMQCGKCYDVCPTEPKSIEFDQEPETLDFEASSVIIASGFKLTDIDRKKEYSTGKEKNVVAAMQMERILAPSGPFGSVMRPSDGKLPENVAFILCAGSRDKSIGVPYCSRVCCMYSIKQAMLLSGALPIADITIYYMDIRAFGKGYEQFYRNAEAMGIKFVKAKVSKVKELENTDLELSIEEIETSGSPKKIVHDLVIMANGILPEIDQLKMSNVGTDKYGFIKQEKMKYDPQVTNIEGLYFAGVAGGPKDITDTIAEAGAAAMKASIYINSNK
ncbi:MAG: CoB--CoM heterodisulfide reductase iron-sulfur subunit A family protein [bacterium]